MSKLTKVETKDAPAAIGPYSQAIKANGFMFCSGQIPLDPATGKLVEGDVTAQAHRVFANIKAVLAAEGKTFDDVVRSECYLADLNDFAAFNEVYKQYYVNDPKPARNTFQVAKLPLASAVEVAVIVAL